MSKIERNAPCWCGSGKKFKKCHLNRESEQAHSIAQMFAEIKKKMQHKACLHPEASKVSCSSKIIDAHTIQKSGPFKRIVDSKNHVSTFSRTPNGNFEVVELGWQKASTFKGFCAKHDKALFSCIEDDEFKGTAEQCFIVGYRAYALEYFKKISVLKGLPLMQENIDRGVTPEGQMALQSQLLSMKTSLTKGIEDFERTLDFYTRHYRAGNFSPFKSVIFNFKGDLDLVVSGCFSPEFSIDGKRLQSLTPCVPFIENISLNTLVTSEGHSSVFSWPAHFESCNKFIESLLDTREDLLPTYIVELIFNYIENVYFRNTWFGSLSEEAQDRIIAMASKSIQYSEPISFSNLTYVNWLSNGVVCN